MMTIDALQALFLFFVGLFGLSIGSFLNVCIYRLPRGQSLITPARSYCPQCGRFIPWYDNIPLLSFLFLKGRCRFCHRPITLTYPLVELLTASVALMIFLILGPAWSSLFLFTFLAAPLIAITFIDLSHRIIPDYFTITGIVAGILYNVLFPRLHLIDAPLFLSSSDLSPIVQSLLFSIMGIIAGGGSLFIVSWLYETIRKDEGIGGGDIKLTAMLGSFFGWKGVFVILLVASLSGSLIGLFLLVIRKTERRTPIPFGPFLSLAAFLYLILGSEIVSWYLNAIHKLY